MIDCSGVRLGKRFKKKAWGCFGGFFCRLWKLLISAVITEAEANEVWVGAAVVHGSIRNKDSGGVCALWFGAPSSAASGSGPL